MKQERWKAGWKLGALLLLLAGIGAGMAGCAAPREAAPGERAGVTDVVEALEAQGLSLQGAGRISDRNLTGSGYEYQTVGGILRIFEYRSESSAALDIGRLNNTYTDTFSAPHIYQQDNIIAIYYGDNGTVEAALSSVLGSKIG